MNTKKTLLTQKAHLSIVAVVIGILLITAAVFLIGRPSSAIDARSFDAGNIISDQVFTNKDSMSVSQIQAFLNSKVTCDTMGEKTSELGGGTRAQWLKSNGISVPITCINEYYENPSTGENNYGKSTRPSGSISAAQIIYNYSRQFNINPQVIIVTLQKENGLITDEWPTPRQYTQAMGFGCPDNVAPGAPACDPQYQSFSTQVYEASRHFRGFMDNEYCNENWCTPKTTGNNTIQWHPDPSNCGTSVVNIQNRATVALYSYTPYRPNQAALNAGYGTGDGCSAYGNRNFYLYFNDWFGSTKGTPFFSISGNGKVYIRGVDSTYYYIPTVGLLRDYGMDTKFKTIDIIPSSVASGMVYAGVLPSYATFEGDEIYAVANSKISHFTSRTMLESNYGLDITKTAKLPLYLKQYYPSSGAVNQVLTLFDDNPIYYIENGKKRHISSVVAFKTLGSPTYSNAPQVKLSSNFANTIPDGAPIITPDTVIRASDTNKYYYWNNDQLYSLSKNASFQLKYNYSSRSSLIGQLSTSPTAIDDVITSASGQYYILVNGIAAKVSSTKATTFASTKSTSVVSISDKLLVRYKIVDASAKFIVFDNGQTIYYNDGYKLYQIYNKETLYGLGGDFNKVVSLPSETKSIIYELKGYTLAPNQLFQIKGDGRVYISGSNVNAYHILSTDIARQYGISLDNIARLPSLSSISQYNLQTLRRYAKDSSGRVWLIDRSSRMELSATEQSQIGVIASTVGTVSDAIINRLPVKEFSIYAADISNGKVYQIENGEKRWFSSRSAFEAKAQWSQIVDYSKEFIATFPEGTPIK